MLTALEQLPLSELSRRFERCRALLPTFAPGAGGMLLCSRLNIYYLSGTLGAGLLWVPLVGEPVLLLRKGLERASLESPLKNIVAFKSYKEVAGLCAEAGSPLSSVIGVDKNGFSWSMAEMIQQRLTGITFQGCDAVLSRARAVKSEWELVKMRLCGERHSKALDVLLPARIHSGMNELEIARICTSVFQECGSSGLIRMNAHGEENYGGYISAGESGNYPTYYDGPLGTRGQHPAVPFMGDAGTVWMPGTILSTDIGCSLEGYTTDRTQLYWAGPESTLPDQIRRAQDLCIEVYNQTLASMKPGVTPAVLWKNACSIVEKAGQMEGFMGIGHNKVPFLGHGIGLHMDEFPAITAGFNDPLEPGMTLAVEPKMGIPGIGMAGLEHTIEITETGARSITGECRNPIPVE